MTEIVEKVAKAIARNRGHRWENYIGDAKSALEELSIIAAGQCATGQCGPDVLKFLHEALTLPPPPLDGGGAG